MRQGNFKVIHHYEGGSSSSPPIEEVLDKLALTHTVMSVTCSSHEFIKNGSNHGHGGSYRSHYVIIAYEEMPDVD